MEFDIKRWELKRSYLEQFPDFDNHEHIYTWYNAMLDIYVIIAIHNRNLGPALGGCRMLPYESIEEAIIDALRLSRGMTYKSALADLPLGGGKMVIIGNPKKHKSRELFHFVGECVNTLEGEYTTGEDMGISIEDMHIVNETSSHVVGIRDYITTSGECRNGDPSFATAHGVRAAIHAAAEYEFRKAGDLNYVKTAIQGLGHVGIHLARLLHRDGATIYVSETDDKEGESLWKASEQYGATIVNPEDIYDERVNVFAPCAKGGILNDDTIPRLQAADVRIVAGSANNQLAEERHGEMLKKSRTVYVPDYLANAGGLIFVTREKLGYDAQEVKSRVRAIGDTTTEILVRAKAESRPTNKVANNIAEERFGKDW